MSYAERAKNWLNTAQYTEDDLHQSIERLQREADAACKDEPDRRDDLVSAVDILKARLLELSADAYAEEGEDEIPSVEENIAAPASQAGDAPLSLEPLGAGVNVAGLKALQGDAKLRAFEQLRKSL